MAMAIDSTSNAYLVGGTTSTDFPTAGTAIPGSARVRSQYVSSAFISVINTTAQTLTYSHCFTGSNYDLAFGVNLGKVFRQWPGDCLHDRNDRVSRISRHYEFHPAAGARRRGQWSRVRFAA